ncbi:hypothetical protein RJ55_08172 [Drechmeria coniospora]|nr:hypothetical protein RJ55_08172 [Drechmeria coniospora]
MSSSAAKWREEQVLIICPGSRMTMAQLGCSELTPPTNRFPTRMFKDGDGREWRPYHTFKRTRVVAGVELEEWVEDVDSDEGAVFPIEGGRIVCMDAFLAFLDHIHSMLTTTYHNTPIMLMASPQWTRPDCETIAQYIFEKTRTPALCMIHSGLATHYGLKWPNMTVIDIGFEKVDVTAIHDGRIVNHIDLGSPRADGSISGGEVFTRKLMKLLEGKGFSREMAEQLKRSVICEVLPYAPAGERLVELPKAVATSISPIAAAPPDAFRPNDSARDTAVDNEDGSGVTNNGNDGNDGPEPDADDDGVLDVAAIVTSGQTKEFLAKKEREKGKSGRKAKDAEGEAASARPVRLPNSKRTHNVFAFEEVVQEEVKKVLEPKPEQAPAEQADKQPAGEQPSGEQPSGEQPAESQPSQTGTAQGNEAAPPPQATVGEMGEPSKSAEDGTDVKPAEPSNGVAGVPSPTAAEPPQQETAINGSNDTPEFRSKRVRRDVEVGLERFTFADREEIDRIVSAIYRTIQGIDDMYMRPACWDNLVFVGNGARLRGLKDNILQTLHARHLISPSTATMFTSELPSNVATPTGTGSQTPTGSFNGAPHQLSSSGVNPLLQAATTASSLGAAANAASAAAVATPAAGSDAAGPAAGHHFHSQTPTSIKTAALPTYLAEWTKNGFEESMFLGAQVAARIAFCIHTNMDTQSIEAQRLMSLSRVDYNELGPKAIRTHSMLG